MENNTQLPVEAVEEINKEAKHRGENHMFVPMDGDYSSYKFHGFIVERSYIAGATAYATQLHQVKQENESLTNQLKNYSNVSNENMKLLRLENEELRRQNDKMKEQATGWRPLLEEVLSKHGAIILMHDSEFHEKIKKFLYGE